MGAGTARVRDGAGLRRPTAGETVELVLGEGVIWVAGAALVAVTDTAALWWAVAGVMVLVLVRWVGRLRAPETGVSWGAPNRSLGTSGYHTSSAGGAWFGGMTMGGDGGGGGGDGGGGC